LDKTSDASLIAESLQGDSRAFDQLVLRYQRRLVHSLEHSIGSRDDALDVAQQAFVLAWRRLSTFRGESGFYSWLYRIARNVAITRTRRKRHNPGSLDQLEEAGGFQPVDDSTSSVPEHRVNQAEDVAAVRQALQQLAEEFRTPLVMKEIDGFTYEQIASILEIPIGTVRSRLFRARQEMAERLQRILRED
jgi:RNA polymerase sigma-70 factor (ECF subfamily)